MLRYLNILAIAALLGSAVYAYSVKYKTILTSEQIVKTQHAIDNERDAIVTLKSEWAHLSRPGRVQVLSDKHLDLQQLSLAQVVKAAEIPDKAQRVDAIGRKLEMLGLAEPTSTPRDDTSLVKSGKTPTSSNR